MFNFKSTGTIADLLPLQRLGNIFGLLPIPNSTTHTILRYYKYYAMILLLVILTCASFSFWGRVNHVYHLVPITVSLVDGMSLIVLTSTNVLTIYNLSINSIGSSRVSKFYESMNYVDLKLGKYCKKMNLRKFYTELIIGHVFVISFYVYDGYFWIYYLGIGRFRNYVFRSLQNYLNFITMLLIRYYVLSLEMRFRGLNTFVKEYAKIVVSSRGIYENEESALYKKPVAVIYNDLCELIHIFNRIYGLPTLFLSLYFVSELLVSLMLSIIYVFQKGTNRKGIDFGPDLFWLCLFWILKDFVSYLKIIAPCDATICEAKAFPTVCYKLLQEMPEKSTYREKCLRSELTLVALQSSTMTPSFSAAGFFTIDFSTLFTLMGFVTSYLVVLIQFD